jgi:hypothetical protein
LPVRPLEVVAVVDHPPDAAVRAAHVDGPAAGELIDPARVWLTGWAVPAAEPLLAVELVVEGRRVGRGEIGIERPGVAAAYDGPLAARAGFTASLDAGALQPGTDLDIGVRAVLADGARPELATVRVRRAELAAEERPEQVSVVIPCFDQAHYLGEAIESVLSQTHPDVELTVVDDGSSDNTCEVAARYPGVRCIRQPNRGVAAARNAGLARSSGAFAVFLDADDRLLPNAVEVGLSHLDEHPDAAFAAGMPRDIGADGTVIRVGGQPVVTHDHYLNLLEDCFIWSGSSMIYRRAALEAAGGFSEALTAADDYELYLKLARRYPVVCHDAVVTEYRRHGSNTTRNAAVVLTSQLQVLRRQRSELRDRRERAARRAGIRKTRAEQGQALADGVWAAWRRRQWRLAWRGARTLARSHPAGLLRLARRTPWPGSPRFEQLEGRPVA